jgi:hypothetical protein
MPSWKNEIDQQYRDAAQGARYELSAGKNKFRILPAAEALTEMAESKKHYKDLPEPAPPYANYKVHYSVGPKRQGVQNIHACGHDLQGGGSCWLCDVAIPQLLKSNNPAKRAQAQAMVAKTRMIVLVSPIDLETGRFGAPKPLNMDHGGGKSLYIRIVGLLKETRYNYEDPEQGFNVKLERIGQGQGTTWMMPEPDPKPSRVPPQVLAQIKPMSEYLYAYSKEEQENAYYGRETTRSSGTTEDPNANYDDEIINEEGIEYDQTGDEIQPDDAEFAPEPELAEGEDGYVATDDDLPDDTFEEPEFDPEPPPPPKRQAPPTQQRRVAAPPARQAPPRQAAPPPPRQQQRTPAGKAAGKPAGRR